MEGFDEFKNILVGVDESEGAQKAFQYAVKQASKTGEGDPAEEITKTILPATSADILIIGSRSMHGIKGYFGSHATYMVKNSPISITVIK